MGGRSSKSKQTGRRPITIVPLGLDDAGKTTTAKVLEKTSTVSITPTIGFGLYEIIHRNEQVKLYDLGGGKSFRDVWPRYYDYLYGFIYVIDSSKDDRLKENHEELKRLLQEEKVRGKPILILANKQDEENALDRRTILDQLEIERLFSDMDPNLYRLQLCTAKLSSSNGKQSRMDPSIEAAFDWLIWTIYEHYETLHQRVRRDIQRRNEEEARAKVERRKLVEKAREERPIEEDDHRITKGFIPIHEAIKTTDQITRL